MRSAMTSKSRLLLSKVGLLWRLLNTRVRTIPSTLVFKRATSEYQGAIFQSRQSRVLGSAPAKFGVWSKQTLAWQNGSLPAHCWCVLRQAASNQSARSIKGRHFQPKVQCRSGRSSQSENCALARWALRKCGSQIRTKGGARRCICNWGSVSQHLWAGVGCWDRGRSVAPRFKSVR